MVKKIRKPVVAGMFYTADPEQLRAQVNNFLANAELIDIPGEIIALVCPHAGYEYSGQVAAYAYKQVQDKEFDAVVIIAPSHQEYFSGASIYDGDGYETPLGVVPVHTELAKAIAKLDKLIHLSSAGHLKEHSLEVQLPFLQQTVNQPQIVPIVMADHSLETCQRLGEAILSATEGKNVLIIASSDLYHGYSYDDCVATDKRTLAKIEEFDPEGLSRGLADGSCQACGGGPIVAMMFAARRMGADRAKVIKSTNSGDVTGQRSGYIVGYGAAVIYKTQGG